MQFNSGMRIAKGNPGEPGPNVENNDFRRRGTDVSGGPGQVINEGDIANAPSGPKRRHSESPGTKGVKVPWVGNAR